MGKLTDKDAARSSERFTRLRVACFEADWSPRLDDRQSVLPVLDLLERQGWISFFHRRVRDPEHLQDDLKRLVRQAQYKRYEMVYVASHGHEGTIGVGSGLGVDRLHGLDLSGRVLYLGGCSIARSRALRKFTDLRSRTGALAVAGYTTDVDWDEAAAFEILLLSWLAYERRGWPREALRATYSEYRALARRLGFAAVWSRGQIPPRRGPRTVSA